MFRQMLVRTFEISGFISAEDITGTNLGQLSHPLGYEIVNAGESNVITECVDILYAYKYSTAPYNGQLGITYVLWNPSEASFVGSSAVYSDILWDKTEDVVICSQFGGSFAYGIQTLIPGQGLNLIVTTPILNPSGNAEGVLNYRVRYRRSFLRF